jgi:hypothetical protein
MLVDLADVSFIDAEGRALLARMRQEGVRLLSAGILIDAIVAEIDAEHRRHSAQCNVSTRSEKDRRQSYDVNN